MSDHPTLPIGLTIQGHSRSPLSLSAVSDLLLRPRRFFSKATALPKTPEVLLVAWVSGIAYVLGQIDTQLVRTDLGGTTTTAPARLAEWLIGSWPQYWLVSVAAGAVAAWYLWFLAGWWYCQRLRWSGAKSPDAKVARSIYLYQDLVMSAPTVLVTLAQTVKHANYAEAWQADDWWVILAIVFTFWSCATSYVAATTTHMLSKWKSRLWFLALPIASYAIGYGFVGALYLMLEDYAA